VIDFPANPEVSLASRPPGDLPATRPSLLLRIRDAGDKEAWQDFVRIYAPVVYGYARRHGLQDADAADLAQEVLCGVSAAAARLDYDPRRGSFRGWLFTLAHHRLHDFLARRRRPGRGSGDSGVRELLQQQPAREEDRSLWDQEYEGRLFRRAAEEVRGRFRDATWQAFWLTAVEGHRPREVAGRLRMTPAAVYLAKSRVMARLRERVRQLEGE
jgi:RNA polymerase sigma-70 factor (ECF subfamily)